MSAEWLKKLDFNLKELSHFRLLLNIIIATTITLFLIPPNSSLYDLVIFSNFLVFMLIQKMGLQEEKKQSMQKIMIKPCIVLKGV